MQITCPACGTSYTLPEGSIGKKGRKVKCASCGEKWHVEPPPPAADPVIETVATGKTDDADDWGAALAGADLDAETPQSNQALWDEAEAEAQSAGEAVDSEKAEPILRKPKFKPVNPLLRTAEITDIKSQLRQPRAEDQRAALREKILRPGVLVATLLVLFGITQAREPIARVVPDLASLFELAGLNVNLTGFEIKNVKSERVIESGGPVLIVSGEIRNVRDVIAQAPRLRLALKTNTNEEIYAWEYELTVPTIVPGGVARFQSRLPAPPTIGRNLSVRFVGDPV
ncbi:MAG: zinc-ribbon domain-containing protein [Pseudomonadota bacterium]